MISGVGYVHENPKVGRLLARKGIQPIGEEELLQIVDLALAHERSSSSGSTQLTGEGGESGDWEDYDPHASSHVITGLEPFSLFNLCARGLDADVPFKGDPRARLLEAILDDQNNNPKQRSEGDTPDQSIDGIIHRIKDRLSSLLLQSAQQIDEGASLSRFGLDSMLAAELRTWIYRTFQVDVSSLALMAGSMTVRMLGEMVGRGRGK
jgi:aryl carrier-like protein